MTLALLVVALVFIGTIEALIFLMRGGSIWR